MDDVLQFSPNPVTFEYTPTRQTTTFLNLRNVSKHPVAYKVKTNNLKRYCVLPTASIIEPYAEMEVELKQQALKEEADNIKECQDRFQLQFAHIDQVPIGQEAGKFHGYESASDLWNAIPNEVVRKARFGVVLKEAKSATEHQAEKGHSPDSDVKPPSIRTAYASSEQRLETSHDSPAKVFATEPISNAATQSAIGTEVDSETAPQVHKEREETLQTSLPSGVDVRNATSEVGLDYSESLGTHVEDSKNQKNGSDQKELSNEAQNEIDYASMEYARERARGIRIAPKISLTSLDEPTKQRVAAERAGELVRTIDARQEEIDRINRDLSEARHRLQDATAATAPAYDVKYEVSECSRVPYAQIAIMAIISGAILQLLV